VAREDAVRQTEARMDELVVGLDGSEESRRALRWAVAVAEQANVPVRAVQAWSYPAATVLPWAPPLPSGEEMDEATEASLREIVSETLGSVPDALRLRVERGDPAAALIKGVSPESVLVMGTRGRGGFTGMVLGSASRTCVEHAPCPVVLVRDEHPPGSGDAILVGKDGSDVAVRALEWASSLAKVTGAAVTAVYSWQPHASEVNPDLHRRLRSEAQSNVEAWIAHEAEADSIEVEGDARERLVELAERSGAKLIVVGRRGTSRLKGITIGSVTSYLVSNSPTAIAVTPPLS
jgi:nucleotide-binding universal stress UspA family protein